MAEPTYSDFQAYDPSSDWTSEFTTPSYQDMTFQTTTTPIEYPSIQSAPSAPYVPAEDTSNFPSVFTKPYGEDLRFQESLFNVRTDQQPDYSALPSIRNLREDMSRIQTQPETPQLIPSIPQTAGLTRTNLLTAAKDESKADAGAPQDTSMTADIVRLPSGVTLTNKTFRIDTQAVVDRLGRLGVPDTMLSSITQNLARADSSLAVAPTYEMPVDEDARYRASLDNLRRDLLAPRSPISDLSLGDATIRDSVTFPTDLTLVSAAQKAARPAIVYDETKQQLSIIEQAMGSPPPSIVISSENFDYRKELEKHGIEAKPEATRFPVVSDQKQLDYRNFIYGLGLPPKPSVYVSPDRQEQSSVLATGDTLAKFSAGYLSSDTNKRTASYTSYVAEAKGLGLSDSDIMTRETFDKRALNLDYQTRLSEYRKYAEENPTLFSDSKKASASLEELLAEKPILDVKSRQRLTAEILDIPAQKQYRQSVEGVLGSGTVDIGKKIIDTKPEDLADMRARVQTEILALQKRGESSAADMLDSNVLEPLDHALSSPIRHDTWESAVEREGLKIQREFPNAYGASTRYETDRLALLSRLKDFQPKRAADVETALATVRMEIQNFNTSNMARSVAEKQGYLYNENPYTGEITRWNAGNVLGLLAAGVSAYSTLVSEPKANKEYMKWQDEKARRNEDFQMRYLEASMRGRGGGGGGGGPKKGTPSSVREVRL